MANEEQLSILKQGVSVWNKWRENNLDIQIDLRTANLVAAALNKANLWKADLGKAELAQFIYLILNNEKIRDVINTLTSKSVLILGRFNIPERKAILLTFTKVG